MSATSDLQQQLAQALGAGYELKREITGGGMSRVFLAVEKSLDRQVVIKVLPPELAAGVNRERFQREIQLAARLQHPHIVPLFSAGALGEMLYYTMPFIAGESLKHALADGARFSVRDTIRILHDVTDALSHAHQHGIVHRDIKPANVLRSGGHAVVTDFGVAKALNVSRPGVAMTASGMVIGTPAYMAPEQLAGDPAADHRVDIYAVGLLGYELLTGANPFSSPSPQQTLASQMTRVPEQLNVRHPDVPPSLAAVIARCLAKAPEERPQSAAQLLAELDALISISGETVSRQRGPRLDRWTVGAIGLTVVATGVVLAVLFNPARKNAVLSQAGARPDSGPVQLTRADSLAIARAVESKLAVRRSDPAKRAADPVPTPPRAGAAGPPPAPLPPHAAVAQAQSSADSAHAAAQRDSMRNDVMREVFDSIAKLRDPGRRGFALPSGVVIPPEVYQYGRMGDSIRQQFHFNPITSQALEARLADMGPPRRVYIGVPRLRSNAPAVHQAVKEILDSLRWVLGQDPRFIVIAADSTATVSPSGRMDEASVRRLGADMVVALSGASLGDGRVQWQIVTRDLTAVGSYGQRATTPLIVSADSTLHGVDSLVRHAVRTLHEMDRAPRRAKAPGYPGPDSLRHF